MARSTREFFSLVTVSRGIFFLVSRLGTALPSWRARPSPGGELSVLGLRGSFPPLGVSTPPSGRENVSLSCVEVIFRLLACPPPPIGEGEFISLVCRGHSLPLGVCSPHKGGIIYFTRSSRSFFASWRVRPPRGGRMIYRTRLTRLLSLKQRVSSSSRGIILRLVYRGSSRPTGVSVPHREE